MVHESYTPADRILIHAALLAAEPFLMTPNEENCVSWSAGRGMSQYICIAVKFAIGYYTDLGNPEVDKQFSLVSQVISESIGGEYTAAGYIARVRGYDERASISYNECQEFRVNLLKQLTEEFAE